LLAGAFEAELLALFGAHVATKQVGALERALEVFIELRQSFGNAKANGVNLAGVATTVNTNSNIVLVLLPVCR